MATSVDASIGPRDATAAERPLALLVVLGTLGNAVGSIDRSVLNILAEPIRKELSFSDGQLGLLTGLTFALFYSLCGLPIARYVDRPTTDRPASCPLVW